MTIKKIKLIEFLFNTIKNYLFHNTLLFVLNSNILYPFYFVASAGGV